MSWHDILSKLVSGFISYLLVIPFGFVIAIIIVGIYKGIKHLVEEFNK